MPTKLTDNIVESSIFAFTPRQVLLGNQTMKPRSDKSDLSDGPISSNLEQKVLLHQSIAHYLKLHGFSKTLKKFRSEAQIEKDNLDGSFVDLEEMCLKYLKVCKDVKANNNNQKEQVAGRHSKKDEEDNMIADMENEIKKKKKKTDQSYSDAGAPELKVTSEDKDNDKKCKEKKKKKKKSKSASESLSNGVNESADDETVIDETKKRSKDKKKKKDKSSNDGNGSQFESPPMVAEVKLRDNASSDAKIVNVEMEKRSKDKKKRRNKSSGNGNVEGFQIEDHIETDSKDSFKTSNEDMTYKKKKDSKKRRRLTSEEYNVLPVDGKMNENLKSDLISDQANIGETIQGNDRLQQPSSEQLNGKINVDLANTGEKSSVQRSQKKQQKGSVEPKLGKAFQRVKADEVVFADERLQDNSYWAKDGAESGYGAKAEEILRQVRGRDFRHEKTKKKRGTYRGGQIDLQSHSIKFNDSDDDDE